MATVVKPFTGIAPYYDILMKGVDYELWIDYIERLFNLFRVSPQKILDIGCGTGTPSILLAKRGYEVVGVDSSEEMLKIAREKARGMPNIRFYLADARQLNLPHEVPFDIAISLFDSLNNILKEDELLDAFISIKKHLKPKSLFIFDMNTIYALEQYWGNKTRVRRHGDIISIWETRYFRAERISELHITVFVPEKGNDLYRRIDEIHREKGYPLSTLKKLLRKAGFNEVHIYQHLTRRIADESVLRIMVVAR